MYINAIRFRVSSDNHWRVWKFVGGQGNLGGSAVFLGDLADLHTINRALRHCLLGQERGFPSEGLEAAIQATDADGNDWIVQRQRDGKLIVSKDGKLLPESALPNSLQTMIFDLDEDGTVLMSNYAVNFSNKVFYSTKLNGSNTAEKGLASAIARSLQQKLGELSQTLGRRVDVKDAACLIAEAKSLRQLRTRSLALDEQRREHATEDPEVTAKLLRSFERLKREVNIARAIAKIARPLLDRPISQKQMREAISRIDAEVSEIKARLGLAVFSDKLMKKDLRTLISILTKLTVYDRLVKSTEESRTYIETKLMPELEGYLEHLEKELDLESDIFREVDSCLTSISLQVPRSKSPEAPEEERQPSSWFEKFKAKHETSARATPQPLDQFDSDSVRAALSHVQERLGDLRGNVGRFRHQHDQNLDRVDALGDRALKLFNQARSKWLELCSLYSLPEDMRLEQLIELLTLQPKIAELAAERERIVNTLELYQKRVVELSQLIPAWRALSGSQRTANLVEPSIILTEARDIAARLDTRLKRLGELKAKVREANAAIRIQEYFKKEDESVQSRWSVLANRLQLNLIASTPAVDDVLNLVSQVEPLLQLAPEEATRTLFPEDQAPVQSFMVMDSEASESDLAELAGNFAQSPPDVFILVLTSSERFFAMMREVGYRYGVPVTQATPKVSGAARITSPSSKPKPPSPKSQAEAAQLALNILTGRDKRSSRIKS